jgi:multicomponent Na+:H+ antiporter subunit A
MLIAIVLSGFLAAPAAPALYHFFPRWAGRLCPLVPLALFAGLLTAIGPVAAGKPVVAALPWLPSLDLTFSLYLDGLGMLFALLVTGIGGLALLAGLLLIGKIAGTMDMGAILTSGDLVRCD